MPIESSDSLLLLEAGSHSRSRLGESDELGLDFRCVGSRVKALLSEGSRSYLILVPARPSKNQFVPRTNQWMNFSSTPSLHHGSRL